MCAMRVQSLRSSVKLQRPAAGSREPGEIFFNFADLQLGVVDSGKNPVDLVAVRFFSPSTDYVSGNFVVQAGTLWRAKGAVPAAAFNPGQWDPVVLGPDMAGKENIIVPGSVAQYWRGDKSWQILDKTAVGLGNVDNTSDANKPVSSAQAAALATKANTSHTHAQADVTNLVGDLALKAPLASPALSGTPTAPTAAPGTNTTQLATTAFVTASGVVGITSIVQTVRTSSGTYTKPAGLKYLEVTVVGAGGGGGSAAATGAGQSACGGGGGGGGTAIHFYAAADVPTSVAYTVGSAGGVASAGNSSIFDILTGVGGGGTGAGSGAGNTLAFATRGAGGTATGGSLQIYGGNGETGVRCCHGNAGSAYGGGGGGTFLSPPLIGAYTGTAPSAGRYGGGGMGAAIGASTVLTSGAAGGAGLIITKEFF